LQGLPSPSPLVATRQERRERREPRSQLGESHARPRQGPMAERSQNIQPPTGAGLTLLALNRVYGWYRQLEDTIRKIRENYPYRPDQRSFQLATNIRIRRLSNARTNFSARASVALAGNPVRED